MISYCIPVYRPWFARRLILDLIQKTSAPCEILVWLNVADAGLENFLAEMQAAGHPLRVVGKTPENIGMDALRLLFAEAQYDLITQMDDDVVCVTPRIAEICAGIFARFPNVKQLVADVWRDEFTSGARPAWSSYKMFDEGCGLYEGPIDGWFSVYHRSILPLLKRCMPSRSLRIQTKPQFPWFELKSSGKRRYFCLGGRVKSRLAKQGYAGLLCAQFKVFHVVEPHYLAYFNVLDFEIEKYRSLGRHEIVKYYEEWRPKTAPREVLEQRVQQILATLARVPGGREKDSYLLSSNAASAD